MKFFNAEIECTEAEITFEGSVMKLLDLATAFCTTVMTFGGLAMIQIGLVMRKVSPVIR